MPSLGSLTRAPWAHPAREPPLDLAGIFKSFGAVATGAGAGVPVASSRRAPLLGREASEITPSARGPGPRSGGIPGEWRPELWASSPAGRHPGDTGAPSSRLTRLVWTRVNPRGRFPGGRSGRRAAEPQPGRAGAGSASSGWSSRRAGAARHPSPESKPLAKASGTQCPRAPRPEPPYPPQASPPPCQGRSKQETQDLTWRDPDFWPGFPLSR